MKELFDKLKARLLENQWSFHQHYSMLGSTETGFYEQDNFDMEALLEEIDDFQKELEAKR